MGVCKPVSSVIPKTKLTKTGLLRVGALFVLLGFLAGTFGPTATVLAAPGRSGRTPGALPVVAATAAPAVDAATMLSKGRIAPNNYEMNFSGSSWVDISW